MFVTYYMSSDPITIGADIFLPDARRTLNEYHFRHLPVIDDDQKLLGMLTDRDLRSAYPSSVLSNSERERIYERVQTTTVREIMSTVCVSLRLDSTIDDALLLFEREKVGALPVIDPDEKLTGIFSVRDLTRAYKKIFGVGEKGSTLIGVKDDGSDDCGSRMMTVLENNGLQVTRLVQFANSGGDDVVYLRLNTFKIASVISLLKNAGFEMSPM